MAKLKIAHKQTDGTLVDQKVRPANSDGVQQGGTGGASSTITSTGAATIQTHYKTSANASVVWGYITAQKGIREFRMANANAAGTSLTTVTLVNAVAYSGNVTQQLANLTAGQGMIHFFPPTGSGSARRAASRITNKFVYDFDGNRYRYKLGGNATSTFGNVEAL